MLRDRSGSLDGKRKVNLYLKGSLEPHQSPFFHFSIVVTGVRTFKLCPCLFPLWESGKRAFSCLPGCEWRLLGGADRADTGGYGGNLFPPFFFFVCLFIGIAIFQEHYDLKNSRDMGRDKRNSKVAGKKNTRKRIN